MAQKTSFDLNVFFQSGSNRHAKFLFQKSKVNIKVTGCQMMLYENGAYLA